MRQLLPSILCLLVMAFTNAQIKVNIKGQITNQSDIAPILIGNGDILQTLELSEDGTFSVDLNYQSLPSFISIRTSSKRGKLTQLLPRIWFNSETIDLKVDLQNKSYEIATEMPFQDLSESLDALDGKSRIELALNNPNQWPSLYFVDYLKKDFAINDLEDYLNKTKGEYKESRYAMRIENYIKAKRRIPLKKGKPIVGFNLPERTGKDYSIVANDGKKKLLAFFSSGCSYSVASIDLLAQLNGINKDQIEIITIWRDSSEDAWLNAHKEEKEKIDWIDLWDQFDFASTYFDNDISPQFFVLDAEGILVDKFDGYTNKTAKKLGELVKQ